MIVQPELPTGYYLDNFLQVGQWVNQLYADLLSTEEQAFWQIFQGCSLDAQRLYVRLALRRGPLFRSDKIQYDEITEVPSAAQELITQGLLSEQSQVPVAELGRLLRKRELDDYFHQHVARTQSKTQSMAQLQAIYGDEPQLFSDLPFAIWQVEHLELIQLWRLLFFGNLRQDFSEFILLDLGRYRYESYEISRDERLFDSRERIEGYLQLFDWSEQLELRLRDADFVKQLAELLLSLSLDLPEALEPRFCRLANKTARQLERQNASEPAMALYRRCTTQTPARERLTRLLHKSGELDAAQQLLEEIQSDPLDEDERGFTERFAPKLRRARGEKVPKRRKLEPPALHLTLENQPELRVETITAQALATEGWQVFYTENLLMNTLFGLSYWQQIFASHPRVFFNHFQRGPRDLFSPDFARTRETSLASRTRQLAAMDNTQRYHELQRVFEHKQGIANYFVNWEIHPELLELACTQIPWQHTAAILQRMLFDLRQNRSGFPDLLAFKPEDNHYCWFEVKGPGDSLQDNQRRWLSYFAEHKIPHQVVWVQWQS